VQVDKRQIEVARPTMIYRVRGMKLVELQFVDREGKVFSVDLRDARKRWFTGEWREGAARDLQEATKPDDAWLDGFEKSTDIAIVERSLVLAAPRMRAVLDAPGKTRSETGEWNKLVAMASTHFDAHLSVDGRFATCEHREMLAIAHSILASAL
jgi:hypothetical protein